MRHSTTHREVQAGGWTFEVATSGAAAAPLVLLLHGFPQTSHAWRDVPPVRVPTLYLWGTADATVGRTAAEGTAAHVTGPYTFEVVDGAGHFLTDDAGAQVVTALLGFLARWESSV